MNEEDCCMTLLCSFPDSWDNSVMAIGSTIKILVLDEVMATKLLEEVSWKASESINEALVVHGILK
jgi:hypothetical protein